MLYDVWRKSQTAGSGGDEPDGPADASDHWAVRALQRVVPVRWTADSDGVCLFRDDDTGMLYVTRTTVRARTSNSKPR